jgi:hypothetical protein
MFQVVGRVFLRAAGDAVRVEKMDEAAWVWEQAIAATVDRSLMRGLATDMTKVRRGAGSP